MKKNFVILSTLIAATFPIAASAQKPATAAPASKTVGNTNLTEEQMKKFVEEQKKNRTEIETLAAELNGNRTAYEDLYASDASDAEVVKAHAELQKTIEKMEKLSFEQLLRNRSVTTSKQRKDMLNTQRDARKKMEAYNNTIVTAKDTNANTGEAEKPTKTRKVRKVRKDSTKKPTTQPTITP